VSLRIQPIAYQSDSALLFAAVRDLPWAVFIDSARPRVAQGRYDIIAAAPYQTLTTRGASTWIRRAGDLSRSGEDPLMLLRRCLACDETAASSGLPFHGGAIGYFGYDLGRRIEPLAALALADDGMPEMAVGIYDWALVVDHAEQAAWLVSQGRDPATRDLWQELVRRFSRPPAVDQTAPLRLLTPVRARLSRAEYGERFERIQSYILEGDCYQVNFAQCFEAETEGDPWSAYLRLRRINPAPFSAYLENPYGRVLCSSPERFLHHLLKNPES